MMASQQPTVPPSGSPPHGPKRLQPHDGHSQSKARARAGFLIDDDSDEEEASDQTASKRRMLDSAGRRDTNEAVATLSQHAASPSSPTGQSPPTASFDTQSIPDAQPIESLPQSQTQSQTQYAVPTFDFSKTDSLLASLNQARQPTRSYQLSTSTGKKVAIKLRQETKNVSYETMVAARTRTKEGRATKGYYGIDINELVDGAAQETASKQEALKHDKTSAAHQADAPVKSVETPWPGKKSKKTLLWTEKYRARTFMDLVGDDLTNRQVLRWLKRWDPLVFPHAAKSKPAIVRRPGAAKPQQPEEEKPHRKILMLTGAPGLGKTTLAHVCARQAGYEVLEINASDDRSRDVVKGRIRTSLGTETVKSVDNRKAGPGQHSSVAKPICVVVDEVDGVVSGSSESGEGGFVKALIDLVMADQRNATSKDNPTSRRKKRGDDFRQMRPLILVCNDVYHPSLRPLRHSGLAEIIHTGRPPIDSVVNRLKSIFEKEGIACEKDAARKLCETAWGMGGGVDPKRRTEGSAEGDLRGAMVVGEWVAGRLKACSRQGPLKLTKPWLESNVLQDLANGGGGGRGVGRGGTRDIVSRIFQDGGGFPKEMPQVTQSKKTRHEQPKTQLGFAEHQRKNAMEKLREMIDASGETDRIMTEIFAEYPHHEFNDDSYLTKPNSAYEWLHFHDTCSSRVFSNQDWELAPYFSQAALACHHLFASPYRHQPTSGYDKNWGADAEEESAPLPFSGPRADFEAYEMEKYNRALLQGIQAGLSPSLGRSFRSPGDVAVEFLPYLVRLVSPDVKPVLVGGSDKGSSVASVRRESEKAMVRRGAEVLADVGITLQKGKIEEANPSVVNKPQWVYRMDPDLDALSTYESAGALVLAAQAPTRFAVRQVLDQELQKALAARENAARHARLRGGLTSADDAMEVEMEVKARAAAGGGGGQHDGSSSKKGIHSTTTAPIVKKDFFGRLIEVAPARPVLEETDGKAGGKNGKAAKKAQSALGEMETKVWVTYHEGLNNAVTKPLSWDEFLQGL